MFKEDDVDALEFGIDNATCSVSYDDKFRIVLIKYSTGITEFRSYNNDVCTITYFDAENNFIKRLELV